MLPKSRVSGSLDVNRFAKALSRPGIDTRCWICLATVVSVTVTSTGIFADVTLLPNEQPETVRIPGPYSGAGFGAYFPVEVGDEILVAFPNGEPDAGGVAIARMWSGVDTPPEDAQDNNNDVSIHVKAGQNIRIVVEDGGKVIIDKNGQGVELGGEGLLPTDGVVHGTGVDTFTGLTYFVLGSTSTIVKAKKS